MQNPHFLLDKPNKPIFHKNFDFFFLCFFTFMLATCCSWMTHHIKTCLIVHIMPFFGSNLWHLWGRLIFVGFNFPLEIFYSSRYNVPTFVEDNPFGRIKCINLDNLGFFQMLFVKCKYTYQPTFYNRVKLKLKWKYFINCSSSNFACLNISKLSIW
jgi:hypothetical protein